MIEINKRLKYFMRKKNLNSNKANNNHLIPKKDEKNINKIKTNLLSPASILNLNNNISYSKLLQIHLVNKKSNIKLPTRNKNNKTLEKNKSYFNTINDDKILKEETKIKFRIHPISQKETNKNIITSEKTTNLLNNIILKISPKKFETIRKGNLNHSDASKNKKITPNKINSIKNNLNSSKKNSRKKKKEYSIINYYYNIAQQKYLQNLNKNIENLIESKNSSSNFRNINFQDKKNKKIDNEFNKSIFSDKNNNLNHWKKIVYKRKIQRKNDFSESFSEFNLFNFEKENNKKDINKFDNNKIIENYLSTQNLTNFKTLKAVKKSIDIQTQDKLDLFEDNISDIEKVDNKKNNFPIFLPSSAKKTKKHIESRNKNNNVYLKTENFNTENNSSLNKNNRDVDLTNFITYECNNKENKRKIGDYYFKKDNYTIIDDKKDSILNSPKFNTEFLINSQIKKTEENNENNINYYISNNWNNNINNNYIIEYNKNKNNKLNTINLSEKKIFKKKFIKINNISRSNNTINVGKSTPISYYSNKRERIIGKNEVFHKKNISLNISRLKKLKNIITSIDYSNKKNKIHGNDLNDKNIILSEIDNDGKINIKFRKLKNSIEKIIRQKSNKKKNVYYFQSPTNPNEVLTYVKKNQGTHISKNRNIIKKREQF